MKVLIHQFVTITENGETVKMSTRKANFITLEELCDDIADLIKVTIEEKGGHYSSPLGVIELTVALHYVYDSPNDTLPSCCTKSFIITFSGW